MSEHEGSHTVTGWSSTPRDRRNLSWMYAALLAWAATFAGGAWLVRHGHAGGALGWALAAVTLMLSILSVLAYGRYLHESDDLQRALQLRGLVLGFGGGWLAISGYRLFELMGLPPLDGGDLMLVMAGLYMVGILTGMRRYS